MHIKGPLHTLHYKVCINHCLFISFGLFLHIQWPNSRHNNLRRRFFAIQMKLSMNKPKAKVTPTICQFVKRFFVDFLTKSVTEK